MDTTTPAEALDARGRRCSMLSMAVAQKMAAMASGAVLEVTTDDPGAPTEMAAWCRRTGNELLSHEAVGDDQRLRIRRGA
ncbi:MAG TPA: sulfurtransferase TusA family protein [Nevskiaceae bacterium]|nr:sulfurtransferase TusA family protein [Nevskiaceae bacterium]